MNHHDATKHMLLVHTTVHIYLHMCSNPYISQLSLQKPSMLVYFTYSISTKTVVSLWLHHSLYALYEML